MALTQSALAPSAGEMSQREQNLLAAIARLDNCVKLIEPYEEDLGEELYADLVAQAHAYASLLTDCREMRMSLKDARIRDAVEEMNYFCAYLEEEFGA